MDRADDPERDPRDQNSRETLKRSRDVCPLRSVVCAEMTHRITGAAHDAPRASAHPVGRLAVIGRRDADAAAGLVEFSAKLVESQMSISPSSAARSFPGPAVLKLSASPTRRWNHLVSSSSHRGFHAPCVVRFQRHFAVLVHR